MSLGVIPMFWLEFLRILVKITKRKEREKLGITGPFVVAKGTLAEAKDFAAAKGNHAAAKTLFIMIKFLDFVSESLVFVHR